jgi:hypothetical protein
VAQLGSSARSRSRRGEAEPARALGEDTLPRCRRLLGPNGVITLMVGLSCAVDQCIGSVLPGPVKGPAGVAIAAPGLSYAGRDEAPLLPALASSVLQVKGCTRPDSQVWEAAATFSTNP